MMINSEKKAVNIEKTDEMNSVSSVLVIGAGIAGMQASLDIADQNIQVYLVDRALAIGGAMAKLDKTLPTNDCAVCIEAPKMVEVGRNSHIELLTNSEVIDVEGQVGNFTVTIKHHPRYVDPAKCSGCGACFEVCPITVPNEFDHGMGLRGAIYRYFAQAVPNVAAIDKDHCINCGMCELVCAPKAINRDEKVSIRKINVGSIIVATGFEEFDPSSLKAFGYGIFPNVITGMQFERLLCASGPTGGVIRRPSDGKIPNRIAWIQCVGSRDLRLNQPYCSRVCCMWGTKQAIIAKEHHPKINPYIFFIDIRAYGKGFEEYYRRGKDEIGIEYIRSRPGEILETDDNNLEIIYEDTSSRKPVDLKMDLVVLSTGMKPSRGNKQLSEIIGLELDNYGFFHEKDPIFSPLETNVDGIYLCGCCIGPKDIPDSVAQASGAAAKSLVTINDDIHETTDEIIEEEPDLVSQSVIDEPPRVGVFICHCGRNIGGYLDVKSVAEFARTLPNVEFVEDNLFTCSDSTQKLIKDAIKENNLNRVVVASCSPRTHEPLFRTTCREAGLNEYLFEMANIRDQCSWVHSHERNDATDKAKDLVSMAVSKVRLLEPARAMHIRVVPEALVVGGGISGLTAAKDLAEMGFTVHLIEKKKQLGGLLRSLKHLFPTDHPAEESLHEIIENMSSNPNIHVYLGTTIKSVNGYIGNFMITLSNDNSNQLIKVGTVILAIGANEFKPTGYYSYSRHKNIMTLLEYEQAIKEKSLPEKARNIILISCVGSREKEGEGHTYCCRVGCATILSTAKDLNRRYPEANIYILHRDFRLVEKTAEEYYLEVRLLPRVHFIRYKEDLIPNVSVSESGITTEFNNFFSGEDMLIQTDLVLLTTPLVSSSGAKELSQHFKIPLDSTGFFQEAHVKLRPLDFATDGIFVCGTAHSPKNISDSIAQASGAATRASIPMKMGYVVADAKIAEVNPDLCVGCGTCGDVCPYGAISFKALKNTSFLVSHVNSAMCKGCGVCAVACPVKAIDMQGFTNLQILQQITEAVHGHTSDEEPIIVGFCCNWCSYAGADLAGISRYQYPSNIRIIRVMCSGRIDPSFILWAFMEGADGVFVSGCHPGDCHYDTGNLHAQERVGKMKETLSSIGINPNRLTLEWISASEGKRFAQLVSEFTERIKFKTRSLPYKRLELDALETRLLTTTLETRILPIKRLELENKVWNLDRCTGCGMCVAACSCGRLNFESGMIHPSFVPKVKTVGLSVIDVDTCSFCEGMCTESCPRLKEWDEKDINYLVSANTTRRTKGDPAHEIIVDLLSAALINGYIDSALIMDINREDGKPYSRIVQSIEELYRVSGKQGLWAPVLSSLYQEILHESYQRLAIVGPPCVIQAVKTVSDSTIEGLSILRNVIGLTIGTFCSGIYEQTFLEDLSNRFGVSPTEILSITRSPSDEKLQVKLATGKIESISIEETQQYLREGCSRCSDYLAMESDISIGQSGSQEGHSTLIAWNPKGKSIINNCLNFGLIEIQDNVDQEILSTIRSDKERRSRTQVFDSVLIYSLESLVDQNRIEDAKNRFLDLFTQKTQTASKNSQSCRGGCNGC
ncbi:MAG: hydrogenase iron-sulfur subunit [Candidatus Hodarchaeales archaeon]|jgi:heterodisulfide reductase subunit A